MDTFKTIDEYINTFPKAVQSVLQTLRQTIKEVIPQAQEAISERKDVETEP